MARELTLAYVNGKDGLWVIYNVSAGVGPYLVSIQPNATEALKANIHNDRIAHVPVGMDFVEAIKLWEARDEEDK